MNCAIISIPILIVKAPRRCMWDDGRPFVLLDADLLAVACPDFLLDLACDNSPTLNAVGSFRLKKRCFSDESSIYLYFYQYLDIVLFSSFLKVISIQELWLFLRQTPWTVTSKALYFLFVPIFMAHHFEVKCQRIYGVTIYNISFSDFRRWFWGHRPRILKNCYSMNCSAVAGVLYRVVLT